MVLLHRRLDGASRSRWWDVMGTKRWIVNPMKVKCMDMTIINAKQIENGFSR